MGASSRVSDKPTPVDDGGMGVDVAFPADPAPPPGLSFQDFRRIGRNGLGDPLNAYCHSMEWFEDRLYVGTTRSNLCMLKFSKMTTRLVDWPVECPERLYEQDMRAQIHRYDAAADRWTEVFRSPTIVGTDGTTVPRDVGYRCMTVFQGERDPKPVLYTSTFASAKGRGTTILRSEDGETYRPVSKPDAFGEVVYTLRLLVPFKGRLFTAATGKPGGNPNTSNLTLVFETRDPMAGTWAAVNEPDFGDPGNMGIFEMIGCGDHLYAGTTNLAGFQIWRTTAEGDPPYRWERVITEGAYRGRNNQGAASLCVFKNALYVGSGIQHGGIDVPNKVGPAGPELIRIHPDGSWDLLVGLSRDTPDGYKEALSGFGPGYDSIFAGYFWRMGAYDGWLYVGTFDWSLMMIYSRRDQWPELFRNLYYRLGPEKIFSGLAGAALYRSFDGENWLPVTTNGFDNPYNYGIRGIVPTPYGLAVGTVNPFGPRVARPGGRPGVYEDNPDGGMEIWLGRKDHQRR